MRYLVSGKQMKQIDQQTIEVIGIPSVVLMERAALAVVEEVLRQIKPDDHILVACGSGNNGADGIAVSRILHVKGYHVCLVFPDNIKNGSEEWELQRNIADKLGINRLSLDEVMRKQWDILVDAVFGVGLSRPIEGELYRLIERLNDLKTKLTIAVDLPSGIHSDYGNVMGVALPADITVTFGYEKLGTSFYPGKAYSGRVIVADIGFPVQALPVIQKPAFSYEPSDLSQIPSRGSYSNKGSFGKVLVVAGSENMVGAAYLSALSAYRVGAGIVKIVTVPENRIILQQLLPEAILEVYELKQWQQTELEMNEWADQLCRWATVLVLGPGLGQKDAAAMIVKAFLTSVKIPTVIDADALNLIAKDKEMFSLLKSNMILTPHLGEMARLNVTSIDWIKENLIQAVTEFCEKYPVICVMKDAVTVVATLGEPYYINSSGNSSMAKAGAGDVLTGVIGGLLAIGMSPFEAASLGVYLHGLAGEIASKEKGNHGVLAREIADCLNISEISRLTH